MYSSGVVTHNKLALYVSDNNKCNLHTSDLPGARRELNFDQVLLLVEDPHHLGVDLVLPLDARPLQSLQFSHHRRRLLNRRDLKHKHDTWRSVFHTATPQPSRSETQARHLEISVSHAPSPIPQLSQSETQARHLEISVSHSDSSTVAI